MSKFYSTSDDYVCPVLASTGKCGEQDALRVMEQFKEFYEGKLHEVDVEGGGDCLELKLKIQRRWIEDLTEQTQMMARIVKELEDEATTRVHMLEDKLRQTSKSAYEVMKRYQTYSISHNLDEHFQKVFYLENDLKNLLEFIRRIRDDKKWSIDGLQFYDINYKDLFGQCCDCDQNGTSIDDSAKLDNKKETLPLENEKKLSQSSDECHQTSEELEVQLKKKTMEFEELKRSMLDMRSALTEEVACKHDMISALKKDIQQLEERCVQSDKQTAFKDDIIKELRKEIKQLKYQTTEMDGIKKQLEEAKITMKRMRPYVDVKTACTHIDDELVIKKSKLIQNKDDIIQIQTDTLNVVELELQGARKREKELEEEVCCRQREIDELRCKCTELEKALESSQDRADNLQKAVDLYINSINVLEASEERAKIEIEQQKMTISNLQEALVNVKQELDDYRQNSQQEVGNYQYLCNVFYVNLTDLEMRHQSLDDSYKRLQDCKFELEIEHFNALQDLALLETQLYKYQSDYREYEDTKCTFKSEIKKLYKQNRCYEHVVQCFKHEMAVMSEQLVHLQEILNLSNQSCREESGQLYKAVHKLQKLSERLQAELIDTEKKVLIENQKNQLKDAKIDELQLIIGQKNADLNIHDEAIAEIKMRLDNAVLENHQLQTTIVSLNSAMAQMQIKDTEKPKKSVRTKEVSCRRSVSECRESEHLSLKYGEVMKELEKAKEKSREKVRNLKRQNEALKEKLATSELTSQRLREQVVKVKQKAEKEGRKEQELTQCKQIIIELRQTLIDLNENFADSEMHHHALAEEFHKIQSIHCQEQEDIYLSCRCEIALYKKMAEAFKKALAEARQKLATFENQNKVLVEEIHIKECTYNECQQKNAIREKEACQCIEELQQKLRESQEEEKKMANFIATLKKEVQKKIDEKKEKQRMQVACTCNNVQSAQQEIDSLKVEIKNMIENQLSLNSENDNLLRQVGCLQGNMASLEEKNRQLKQKVDRLYVENKSLKETNKNFMREKENFLQTVRNLEIELTDAKNNRDDICSESRHVVNNVKAWLEEQKRINEKVMKRTKCYCETIAKLKQERDNFYNMGSTPCRTYDTCSPDNCPALWTIGSQGSDSIGSPVSCSCSVEEWYSPTYRDDDETDINEDQFIETVEAITNEIRCSNRKWKNKCRECVVSKDKK